VEVLLSLLLSLLLLDFNAANRSCMKVCMACLGFCVLPVLLTLSSSPSSSGGGGGACRLASALLPLLLLLALLLLALLPDGACKEMPSWLNACSTLCMKASLPPRCLPW
jgi:hypothetical protein